MKAPPASLQQCSTGRTHGRRAQAMLCAPGAAIEHRHVNVVSMLSAPASGSAACTAVTAGARDHRHPKASSCTFRAAV